MNGSSARIIAFDPGKTTGFCLVDFHDNGVGNVAKIREIAWDNRFSILPLLGSLSLDGPLPIDAIVVESFHLYNHEFKHQVGSEFPSVRIIGIIEAACWQYNLLDRLHLVQPHVKKYVKIVNPEVAACGSEHMKDAYQLARYWYITKVG